MFSDITFNELENKEHYLMIDVRSQGEFNEATIPDAINIPLFDNEERATVGTIYKQQGPDEATEMGIQLVSRKIPALMKQIKDALQPNQTPVFFCWRGGMRSKTMATLFGLVAKDEVFRLEGGYRSYREYILERIKEIEIKIPTFVLHGMTGVGKTLLLHELTKHDVNVIDLESLAGHRGSIFGAVGDINPVNQKTFDSLIYEELKDINSKEVLVLEAESKRIGKVILPENVLVAKENGHHIMVNASLNTRIQRIIDEYQPAQHKESILDALTRLSNKIPPDISKTIFEAFDKNDFRTIVELLLAYYYDSRYQHSTMQYQGTFVEVNSDNLQTAAIEIAQIIKDKISTRKPVIKSTI